MRPYAGSKKFGRFKQPAQEVAAQWQRQWGLAWLRVTPLLAQRDDLLNKIALLRVLRAFSRSGESNNASNVPVGQGDLGIARRNRAGAVFAHIGKVQIATALPKHSRKTGRRHKRKPRKRRGRRILSCVGVRLHNAIGRAEENFLHQ